jgi:transposase
VKPVHGGVQSRGGARLDEPGETLSSVAQALGVAATQVKTWRLGRRRPDQRRRGAAPGEAAELQQLRCDNKRLQEENEILRKLLLFRQAGGESMKAKLVFISAQCSIYSIRLLCAVLGVVRSWFHDWRTGDQDPESTPLQFRHAIGRRLKHQTVQSDDVGRRRCIHEPIKTPETRTVRPPTRRCLTAPA